MLLGCLCSSRDFPFHPRQAVASTPGTDDCGDTTGEGAGVDPYGVTVLGVVEGLLY